MGRQDEIRRLWRALATAYYSNLLGYNYAQISPVFPAHHRFSIFDLGSIREWTDVCVRSGRLLSTANSRRSITHRPRRDIDRLRITRYDSSRSARLRVHILLHTLLPPPLSPEMIELRTRACLPTWKPRISVYFPSNVSSWIFLHALDVWICVSIGAYIYIQVSNEFLWIENTKRGISNESESSIEERKREEVYRGKREKEQEEEKVQTEIYNSRKEKSATNALGNID